jgi:hypothetical protein
MWTAVPRAPCPADGGFDGVCTNPEVFTCVLGSNGCTEWGAPAACTSDVGCCVPCSEEPCDSAIGQVCTICPLGAVGAACKQDIECAWNACSVISGTCVSNPCADRRRDGRETDIDCGGGQCKPCFAGQGCRTNLDCDGLICTESFVCE